MSGADESRLPGGRTAALSGIVLAALLAFPALSAVPGVAGVDRAEAQVTLEAPEADLVLTIGGWIQPRYDLTVREGDESLSDFTLRRVRLDVRGQVLTERLTFQIMPELSGTAFLQEGWLNYAFSEEVQLRFGQHTVPFQWHRFVSARRQHFVERGVPSETFGVAGGRDLGLTFHGRLQDRQVGYAVGFYDGAARTGRSSSGNMASARVVHAVLGKIPDDETDFRRSLEPNLAFGLGGQTAWRNMVRDWSLGRSRLPNFRRRIRGDWLTGTAFGHLAWEGLSLAADGYLRHVSPFDPDVESYGGWGYMVSGGYAVVPDRLEAVARISELKLDREDPTTKETEWGLGVNVYQVGHAIKTRVQWMARRRVEAAGSETDHRVVVEQHLQF